LAIDPRALKEGSGVFFVDTEEFAHMKKRTDEKEKAPTRSSKENMNSRDTNTLSSSRRKACRELQPGPNLNKGALMNFESFHLHPHIESGIRALRYTMPTPIQVQSVPAILQGRDMIGLAQTGTGKTAAFALPVLQRLLTRSQKRVRALILAPTRELAEQIHEAVGQLGRYTPLKCVAVYGGVNQNPQIRKLREGAEIVVACPGRLIDLLNQGAVSLSTLEVLVLDEADRMFDMGFLPDIRKIMKHIPARRQTLLFSATMPDDIRNLAKDILHDPVTVQVGESVPVSTVAHAVYPVEQHLKTSLLVKLLHQTDTKSVLIFTRTKHRATRLSRQMMQAGFAATSLQGDLTQQNRQKALGGFRNGTYHILVATDIAARGIDVTRISHVINYDAPDTVDAYTHRIGRTGRAERSGDAFTFMTPKDRSLVWDIENVLGEKMERRTLDGFDYRAPAPAYAGRIGTPYRSDGRSGLSDLVRQMPPHRSAGLPPDAAVTARRPADSRKGRVVFSSPRPNARRARLMRSH
jgi:ATP-dependent RNA helicase RhlE